MRTVRIPSFRAKPTSVSRSPNTNEDAGSRGCPRAPGPSGPGRAVGARYRGGSSWKTSQAGVWLFSSGGCEVT